MSARRIALFASLVLALPTLSAAAGTSYFSAFLGYSMAAETSGGDVDEIDFKDFGTVALAFGKEYPVSYARLRLEAEVSYRQNEIHEAELFDVESGSGRVWSAALMLNAYYGIPTRHGIQPYVMAGAGGAVTSVEDLEVRGVDVIDDTRTQWAYQLGAGVGFDVSPAVSLDLQFRYFSTSRDTYEDEADDRFEFRYRTYTFGAGLRYRF